MPEGVGAAVEKREVSASFHELRGSVKKKKKKKARSSRTAAAYRQGVVGLAGHSSACCLTQDLARQRQEAGCGYLSHSKSWAPSAPW